jgi:hypothetical protein
MATKQEAMDTMEAYCATACVKLVGGPSRQPDSKCVLSRSFNMRRITACRVQRDETHWVAR